MTNLEGRVAIVTGASRGLGKDIALGLARAGASVVVAARTDAEGDSRIPGSLAHTVRLANAAGLSFTRASLAPGSPARRPP